MRQAKGSKHSQRSAHDACPVPLQAVQVVFEALAAVSSSKADVSRSFLDVAVMLLRVGALLVVALRILSVFVGTDGLDGWPAAGSICTALLPLAWPQPGW